MWRAFGWVHSNLFDMTGLDVSHAVMESIYRQYYDEPRYRPVAMTAQRTPPVFRAARSGEASTTT